MFDRYYTDLKLKRYIGLSESNTPMFAPVTDIKGLRIKGQVHVTHSKDGDSTTCSIVYRVNEYIQPQSFINGREVTECVKTGALMMDTGYLAYVK